MEVGHVNIPGPEKRVGGVKGSRRVNVGAVDGDEKNGRCRTEGQQEPLIECGAQTVWILF